MSSRKQESTPAPLETEPGTQKDDNIDDLGHRPDGTEQDQPVDGDEGKNKDDKPKRR
ncbi:hypothetical protein [Devosia elaeis]|jgi:hypothetical protein|uniref:hypothetical protein n=1 Tax=Devosia elaeis TaxID=1770058 RepID=UPI000A723C8F|nr:hypothetical protein [Devosia elaeis]